MAINKHFFLYKKTFFMYEIQFKSISCVKGDEYVHEARKNSVLQAHADSEDE